MVNPTGYTALDLIGYTDKGTYSVSATYVKNDLVHYNGNIWRVLVDDTTGITPTEGVNYTIFIESETNAIAESIAPVEQVISTHSYSIGEQLYYNEILYDVIANIAIGDTLTVNTNIQAADTITEQISAVKQNLSTLDSLANLKGKTIAVFGSSNEVDGYSGGNNWVTLMANMLSGYATVVNKSVAGQTVLQSIADFIADNDKATYDIILFTSTRNLYKAQSYTDIFGDGDQLKLGTLYTTINSLQSYVTLDQQIYFASCLPFADDFKHIPMCIYDGVVKKACGFNGFKMLDMHSWLHIQDADATSYTTDGHHYVSSVMPILAKRCVTALAKGGEQFSNYSCVKKGTNVLDWSGFSSITSGVVSDENVDAPSFIYADIDFNISCKLYLKNTTGDTISADTSFISIGIFTILSGIAWVHKTVETNEYDLMIKIRNRPFSIQTLTDIPDNTSFVVYREGGDILKFAT